MKAAWLPGVKLPAGMAWHGMTEPPLWQDSTAKADCQLLVRGDQTTPAREQRKPAESAIGSEMELIQPGRPGRGGGTLVSDAG